MSYYVRLANQEVEVEKEVYYTVVAVKDVLRSVDKLLEAGQCTVCGDYRAEWTSVHKKLQKLRKAGVL